MAPPASGAGRWRDRLQGLLRCCPASPSACRLLLQLPARVRLPAAAHPPPHGPPSLQWAVTSATSFQTIAFTVPEGCQLASLALCSQRPLCLAAPSLSRCARLCASARRVYLGLPLRQGAPWADVDELAARWAQVGRPDSWRGAAAAAVCAEWMAVQGCCSIAGRLWGVKMCAAARSCVEALCPPPATHCLPDLSLRLQFMLAGSLEAVEITATRFFVFQPVQGGLCLVHRLFGLVGCSGVAVGSWVVWVGWLQWGGTWLRCCLLQLVCCPVEGWHASL